MSFTTSSAGTPLSRRAVLALTGGALAVVAGCLGSGATDGSGAGAADGATTSTASATASSTANSSTGDAAFTISAVVPEQVEVGEPFTYEVTIANEGDVAGEATYGLDVAAVADDRWEPVFEDTIELVPGESETVSSEPVSLSRAQTFQWEFWVQWPQHEEAVRVETVVVTPTRRFGEPFRTPNDLVITAADPHLVRRYEYTDFLGDPAVHRAPDGEQFALVDLAVENDAGETRETPNPFSFQLVAGGRQFDPMGFGEYERDDIYVGLNTIVHGVVESGVLAFQIPDGVGRDELVLFHDGFDFERDAEWEVLWEVG